MNVEGFYDALAHAIPAPATELEYQTPYQLLVAVALSAQSTDRAVNAATKHLFSAAPTPEAMLALGQEGVIQHIRTLGLFNNKAKNLIALSAKLLAEFHGEVPRQRSQLESLPGVGRKTANVILNTLFGEHTIAVDTHIFRVANRTGLAPGKTPLAVEKALMAVTPERHLKDAHHLLILFGRYTCIARRPKCTQCPVYAHCGWDEKTPRES